MKATTKQLKRRTNSEIRCASGEVKSESNLVAFLYMLLRDHLPAGTVEELVTEAVNEPMGRQFTNGWLAQHAISLAEDLEKENQEMETQDD